MHFQEHVEGENCDRCKPGFFNLQQNNPKGCEECFCSGKTNVCTHSHLTYRSVRKIIPYQCMSLVFCFSVLSLSIVTEVHLIIKSCMFFYAPYIFHLSRKNVYKLCFSSLWESSEKVRLSGEKCKRSYNSQIWSHVHKHSPGMCIHNQSWVKCNISIGQPLFQVIIKFLDLK